MTADHLKGIEEFEAGLWKIADTLRANSNLASNEYSMSSESCLRVASVSP
jgi:type I restriction enzyme M protein